MKERPIIFSTSMVQAILEGRKTHTRRIVKPQPDPDGEGAEFMPVAPVLDWEQIYNDIWKPWHWETSEGESISKFCPYGMVGDVLWVRETWMRYKGEFLFKANEPDAEKIKGWKPSIHMPKEARRLFLKIQKIVVQKVKEISEDDAIKEGVELIYPEENLWKNYLQPYPLKDSAKQSFISLWHSIHKSDPVYLPKEWVWVIDFSILKIL